MTDSINSVDREGDETGIYLGAFRSVFRWIRRDFVWGLLVVPMVLSAAVWVLSVLDVNGWGDTAPFKDLMEIVHPSFIAGFLLVSWWRWFSTRNVGFAFLGILGVFVLSRELMGQGWSVLLYAGLVSLCIYATRNQQKLDSLFPSRWAASFLLMCFVCYVCSQLLDRGAVKRIGWLLTWDKSWEVPYSSNFEEALEVLGGVFLLLTPWVVVIKKADR